MKPLKTIILEKLKVVPKNNSYDNLADNQFVTTVGMWYSWLVGLPFQQITCHDLDKSCTPITDDNWVNFDSTEDVLDFLKHHKDDEIIITPTNQYGQDIWAFEIDGIIFSEPVDGVVPERIKLN